MRTAEPTSHLKLREATAADIPALFALQEEPGSVELAAIKRRTRDEFEQHWRDKVLDTATSAKLIIELDGEIAGYIVAWGDPPHREVGYWIARAHWGRGIATHALSMFLDEHERRRPLVAVVAQHNAGSLRVLEKLGFTRTGTALEPDGVTVINWQLA